MLAGSRDVSGVVADWLVGGLMAGSCFITASYDVPGIWHSS